MAVISGARGLGAAVRAERKRRGWSQVVLAENSSVSRAWLARFETGHPAASLEQVFRVLTAMDLELSVIKRRVSPAEGDVLAALARQELE